MTLYSDKLTIKGGQIPSGCVSVSGAKNSATRLLSAAMLTSDNCKLTNFPLELVDVKHKIKFLEKIGFNIKIDKENEEITIYKSDIHNDELSDYFFPIRTTYLLVAGQLNSLKVAKIPYPGGCNIGERKYDMHIMVWENFGCEVRELDDHIEINAPANGINGSYVNFPISTVGGTENALLMASIANGKSTIVNAYITPEISDLIGFLRTQGVKITVIGNSHIEIEGGVSVSNGSYSVMPDRIEALTWIVYAIISQGDIEIVDVPFGSLKVPLIHLESSGINIYRKFDSIIVKPSCLADGLVHSFELACGTHPGIISDMQPFFVLLGMIANGTSRIHDYRYPNRIAYIKELNKFYTDCCNTDTGLIKTPGNGCFVSSNCKATDLRGTMACVLAALSAEDGVSEIEGVSMALRGYNNLQQKLKHLGVEVSYTA